MQEQTQTTNIDEKEPVKHYIYILGILVSVAAIGVSLYLTTTHLRMLVDPAFKSVCNVTDSFNCDKVNSSEYSEFLSLPSALYGVAFYVTILMLNTLGLFSIDKEKRKVLSSWLLLLSTASVFVSFFLMYVSKFVIGAWCPFCITLYLANFSLLALSQKASGTSFSSSYKASLEQLPKLPFSIISYAIAISFGMGIAILGFWYKSSYEEGAKEIIENFNQSSNEQKNNNANNATDQTPSPTPSTNKVAAISQEEALKKLQSDVKKIETLGHEPIRGKADSPVVIKIFSDFQCPYCKIAALSLEELLKKFPDKVSIVYKHYPLDTDCNSYMEHDMHPMACEASIASICAGKQGQFWEMHDILFKNQPMFAEQEINGYAQILGLDMASFQNCLKTDRDAFLNINKDIEQAQKIAIDGTPAIFINDQRWRAAPKVELLEPAITAILQNAK